VSDTSEDQGGSRAAIAGLVFGVLYLTAFVVIRGMPDASAPTAETIEFYSSDAKRRWVTIVAAYLVPLGGIALLWFTAAVRHRVATLTSRQDELLSTVQLLSAALYVAMLFTATAIVTAPAIAIETGVLSVEEAVAERSLMIVGDTIFVVFALRAAGVFIAAGTTRAWRAGLIPKWFAILSYVLVLVLLLTVARVRAVTLLFPMWVVVMSVVVLTFRRTRGERTSA
jgi:hypothetical protein